MGLDWVGLVELQMQVVGRWTKHIVRDFAFEANNFFKSELEDYRCLSQSSNTIRHDLSGALRLLALHKEVPQRNLASIAASMSGFRELH